MSTATATPETETTLYLKRIFKAPREQVFNAWTKPEMLKQWFAAGEEMVGSVAEVDLRVGGKFLVGMKHIPTGKEHVGTGIYKVVQFPERLVFTWKWEEEEKPGQMRITIEFRDLGGQTEMNFKHEFFVDKKSRDGHEDGWNACFKNLEKILLS